MALTEAEKQEIIDGVLDSDHRIYAIQGTLGGDLSIDEGDTLMLTFTPSSLETVSTSLARLTPARAAALDLLAGIKAKTDLITTEGQVLVSEASQGRIPDLEAYVFCFYRSTGEKATGIANTLSADWRKDGVTAPLADTTAEELQDGKYFFNLSESERTFQWGAVLLPESSNADVEVVSLKPIFGMLESLIWSKAGLIGTGAVTLLPSVVSITGTIEEIIIGDDYSSANGNPFTWTVGLPTGATIGGARCFFGGWHSDPTLAETNKWKVEGTVTEGPSAGTAYISFNLLRASTINLAPGDYIWSAEIWNDAGLQSTKVRSKKTRRVTLVEKQTI